jgi:putative ABC transport system permease protein
MHRLAAARDMVTENVAIAFTALRVSKLRSALTILGVVIVVATVMTMAALVQGIQRQIVNSIEVAGPTTFWVVKIFSQTPLNPDQLPKHVRIRPDIRLAEAERIRSLDEIAYASLWAQVFGRLEYRGERTRQLTLMGADDGFPLIQGGELSEGRWFTGSELASGAPVAVLGKEPALKVFGRINPIGKEMRVAGRVVRVIGLYEPPSNIFAPPGSEVGAILPFRFVDRSFNVDRTNGLFIPVKPRPSVPTSEAQDAVTVALREMRGLRPGEKNTFDLIAQDEILATFNSITGAFFLVMVVLASVALMVGGIGVMAIMMVSVTDRTREIGVRKALGATRGDIMVQFLIEAATLTGIGGAIGILTGLGMGTIITSLMDIEAATPIEYTVIAVVVSIAIGIVFGLLPARKAARLDPVEALRYE